MALTITIPGAVEATIGATAPAILTVGVGVPGATGATGATGAQGPQGDPGEGVPVGGTAGQVLAKIDGTNYNTEWSSLPGFLTKAGNLSDLADVGTANTNLGLGEGNEVTFLALNTINGDLRNYLDGNGLQVVNLNTENFVWIKSDGIQFADLTVQTTAYTGGGDYLPLAGGAMDANASITVSDTTMSSDSEMTGEFFKVKNSSDNTENTAIYYNGLYIQHPIYGAIGVGSGGIQFPDSSFQSTAFLGGDYLPLAGGAMDNDSAITIADNTSDIEMAGFGFGVQLSSDIAQNASLQYGGVQVQNNAGTMLVTASGLTFPDASVQTIAFPGFNNTALTGSPTAPTPATSDNDTSIATTAYVKAQAFGDRYLTSSTTSNTISNGNKTFTIGTGLSYTPTQNITISYDASNHMHGEVLTYNSGTGVLTVDVNHHTGSGTYASWVVNVGGVTPATSVAFADITGAVSGNTNLQAALDLKANLASPTFTGTPSLPTGSIGVTQSPGNNTTALATTAFVTAAVPAFATNAQALTGTSATTGINPLTAMISQMNTATAPSLASSLSATNTAGSSTAYINGATFLANGTAAGYVSRSCGSFIRGGNTSTGINWTRPVAISARIGSQVTFQTQCVYRLNIGGTTAAIATPTVRSIGVSFGASSTSVLSALVLEVHDGTTLSSVTTSFTPTHQQMFDVAVYSDGAGNAYCYVNGSEVGSSSGAPSTAAANGQSTVVVGLQNVTTPTATSTGVLFNLKFLVN